MKKTQSLFVLALSLGLAINSSTVWALTPQAREYYIQAQQAERRGNLEEAEQTLRKAIALDSQDYLNYVKLASILNQQGKPNEAASYYQKALSLNPQDVMLLYSLAGVYEQLGQYQKAEEAYALTLQNNPNYQFALMNLARTEIQQKKYDPAIAHYEQFLTRYPDHIQARRHLAKLYLVTGKEAESVKQYDLLKARFPEQFGDHLDLARALNGANEPEKALEELKAAYAKEGGKSDISEEMGRAHAALGQTDLAIHHYQKAFALNPAKDDLLLRMADLHQSQKKMTQAIENYQAFLKLHPDNQDVRRMLVSTYLDDKRYETAITEMDTLLQATNEPQQRYDIQKDMAYATQMTGDLSKAISLYETLTADVRTSAMAEKDLQLKSNLAIAYHKSAAYDKAVTLYKQIYYADPQALGAYQINRASMGNDLAVALTALGDTAYKASDFNTATAHYGDATLYAAKENYWPYLGLGNTYYNLKMQDKALEAYNAVLEKDPKNVTALLNRTRLAMAHTEGKPGSNGASSENIQTLETLATENPGNLEVLITLADAYSAQDNASGAISVYEKALALQPDNIDLLLALGTQWQSLGNFEQAKNTYQRALAINDKLPMLHYNMGIVYNELGLLDESASAYKQAMMLDPTNSDSRYGLAITLEKQRKYQDALEIYQVYASDPAARYLKEAKERIGVLQQSMSPATPAGAGNKPAPANQPPAQQPTGNGVIQNSDGIQAGGAAPVPQTPQLPRIELNGQPL